MLRMSDIKPCLVEALTHAGYVRVQQSAYDKWTKGRGENVWIHLNVVRANGNTPGAELVRSVAGMPNGSVSEAQQGTQDSWYTDGYRGRGTAAI